MFDQKTINTYIRLRCVHLYLNLLYYSLTKYSENYQFSKCQTLLMFLLIILFLKFPQVHRFPHNCQLRSSTAQFSRTFHAILPYQYVIISNLPYRKISCVIFHIIYSFFIFFWFLFDVVFIINTLIWQLTSLTF